jgi:hypothetical protein
VYVPIHWLSVKEVDARMLNRRDYFGSCGGRGYRVGTGPVVATGGLSSASWSAHEAWSSSNSSRWCVRGLGV